MSKSYIKDLKRYRYLKETMNADGVDNVGFVGSGKKNLKEMAPLAGAAARAVMSNALSESVTYSVDEISSVVKELKKMYNYTTRVGAAVLEKLPEAMSKNSKTRARASDLWQSYKSTQTALDVLAKLIKQFNLGDIDLSYKLDK